VLAPALLAGAMGALTIYEAPFLREVGWSSVHRTPTEWPSLLAVGPGGWLMVLAFAIAAVLGAWLAAAAWAVSKSRRERLASTLLGLTAVGLVGVAFPADSPNLDAQSWHAAIHNEAYPLIPLGTVGAALVLSVGRPHGRLGVRLATPSRLLVPVMLVAFACTNVDDVAQVARYFAFAALLTWTAAAGWAVWQSALEPSRGPAGSAQANRRQIDDSALQGGRSEHEETPLAD
jgi:hypothetical protein